MPWWWSWLLTAVGVTGMWLTGRRLWVGWAVGLAGQTLWLTYAVVTGQYGFILASAAYGTVQYRNMRLWRAGAIAQAARTKELSWP